MCKHGGLRSDTCWVGAWPKSGASAEVLVVVRGGDLMSLIKTFQISVPVPVTMWHVEVLVAVRGGDLVSLSKTCQINVPVPVTMWRVDGERL